MDHKSAIRQSSGGTMEQQLQARVRDPSKETRLTAGSMIPIPRNGGRTVLCVMISGPVRVGRCTRARLFMLPFSFLDCCKRPGSPQLQAGALIRMLAGPAGGRASLSDQQRAIYMSWYCSRVSTHRGLNFYNNVGNLLYATTQLSGRRLPSKSSIGQGDETAR